MMNLFTCGFNDIEIMKENWKSESYCCQNKYSSFDYGGVEKSLVHNSCVNNDDEENPEKKFTPKRFIVIQMN